MKDQLEFLKETEKLILGKCFEKSRELFQEALGKRNMDAEIRKTPLAVREQKLGEIELEVFNNFYSGYEKKLVQVQKDYAENNDPDRYSSELQLIRVDIEKDRIKIIDLINSL